MKTKSGRGIRWFWLLAASAVLAASLSGLRAAYLEDGPGERDAPAQPEIIRPIPVPVDHPLKRLLSTVDIGPSHHYRQLTLYPLRSSRTHRAGIHPLDEALRNGWVIVREREEAQVDTLRMRNESRRPILALAGEMITGGKQNRIVRHDVLLPAHSGFIDVPVYCGEKERWTHEPQAFKQGGVLADAKMRRMAVQGAEQESVWREIDSRMDAAGVASPTKSYQQVYAADRVRRELDEYVTSLRRVCTRETVGIVAVSHGRIVGADLFSDPDLLSTLWDKICRSYALSARHDPHPHHKHHDSGLSSSDIRRFLDRVQNGHLTSATTPGGGGRWRLHGRHVHGSALTWQNQLVHAALFDETPVVIYRDDRPPVEPIPYRTDDKLWR